MQRIDLAPYALATILALGANFAWLGALLAGSVFIGPWVDRISTESALFAAICVVCAPAPFICLFLLFIWLPWHIVEYRPSEFQFAFERSLSFTVPVFAVVCISAVLVAVQCYLRQRLFSEKRAIGWAIFVFCLGIPGFIGYLLHRRWPVLVRCPHCGQETPRDRDACLKCNTAFPPPALKGIEVFA
jgi:hypothetical protein